MVRRTDSLALSTVRVVMIPNEVDFLVKSAYRRVFAKPGASKNATITRSTSGSFGVYRASRSVSLSWKTSIHHFTI